MTIEIPTPSTELLSQVEMITLETSNTETAAVAAIRERFAPYAKHNGYVRLAHYEASTCNWSVDRSVYYKDPAGKKMKALLACDDFTTGREQQNNGSLGGKRLYLLATGQWLEIKRTGSWSAWQGSPNEWGCGVNAYPQPEDFDGLRGSDGGYGKIRTDAEVAASWCLEELIKDLGKAMSDMCTKLPERHSRLKAQAELAARVVEALKS